MMRRLWIEVITALFLMTLVVPAGQAQTIVEITELAQMGRGTANTLDW